MCNIFILFKTRSQKINKLGYISCFCVFKSTKMPTTDKNRLNSNHMISLCDLVNYLIINWSLAHTVQMFGSGFNQLCKYLSKKDLVFWWPFCATLDKQTQPKKCLCPSASDKDCKREQAKAD